MNLVTEKYLVTWNYKIIDQYGTTVSGTKYLGIFNSEEECKNIKGNPELEKKMSISNKDDLISSKFNIIKVDCYE